LRCASSVGPIAMENASWEHTLKQYLTTLPLFGVPFFEPFGSCSGAGVKEVSHKLPECFSDRNWDLGTSAGHEMPTHCRWDAMEEEPCEMVSAKPPPFFFNKQWDLSSTAEVVEPVAPALELPKPDDSLLHSRQRRCCFCLQTPDRFGMVLAENPEPLPGGLLVVTHMDAWSAFARTAGGGCGLMDGDVILEVNGRQGSASELREVLRQSFSVKGKKTINVVVRARPPTFSIELRREGKQWQKLGVAASVDQLNPKCLLVQSLHGDGLVPAWNTAHGSLRICNGDLITHINGVSEDVEAMKKEIQQSSSYGSKLHFRVVTPVGRMAGCEKTALDDGWCMAEWQETTVPWDMKVRWIEADDNISIMSTACGSSAASGSSSGTRTPEESCSSGTRTPL